MKWKEKKSDGKMAQKFLDLMENYFYHVQIEGFSDFHGWCDGNLDTEEEMEMLKKIGDNVTYIADQLFPDV